MSKQRYSLYIRHGETIVSAVASSTAPDVMDEIRVQAGRAFFDAMSIVDGWGDPEDADAEPDPGTVPTTDLPPLD